MSGGGHICIILAFNVLSKYEVWYKIDKTGVFQVFTAYQGIQVLFEYTNAYKNKKLAENKAYIDCEDINIC